MAGGIPPSYMAVVFLGSGICGLFCNLLRGITLLCFPTTEGNDVERNQFLSAMVFFSVAAAIMVLNTIFQIILSRNKFAVYYLDWLKNPEVIKRKISKLQENKKTGSVKDFNENYDYNLLNPFSPKSEISIAEEPKNETVRTYFPTAKRNF